jgi:MoxR-vWA-beta-propeller ternary system domain bpX1/MoxR-vWA-beta-propeller ternary system domain bpX0
MEESERIDLTLEYFGSRVGNFWHWSEEGEVVEWQRGNTLCYQVDLLSILRGCYNQPMPHLGAILLVVAACSDNWDAVLARKILNDQVKRIGWYQEYHQTEALYMMLDHAFDTLKMVHGLSKDVRSEAMRIPLIRAVFENLLTTNVAFDDIEPFVECWAELAEHLTNPYVKDLQPVNFLQELAALQNCAWEEKGTLALEQYLLTNLTDTPKPADIAPLPEPITTPLTLIEELLQDDKTEGLAQLTQRLMAAINIPAQTKGTSDQPFGGYSDITNRGNLDRLLISELAQDDDTLTARLVNNEAMYLRREEPPSDIERERTILLDTTIQMWGLPRVFALAAALACAEKRQNISHVDAFALRGDRLEDLDLTTKKGVTNALGNLDGHLHCGIALRDFLRHNRASKSHDIIFITDADALKTPDFQVYFTEIKAFLTYLIVVNREGELQVLDISGGRSKSLGTSKMDLNHLLFPVKDPTKRSKKSLFTPVFYSEKPLPLYYLTTNARISRMHLFEHPSVGVVNITQNQRVLRVSSPDVGATELLPFIEEGEYCIGFANIFMLYIIVSNERTRLFKLYKIYISKGLQETHDFTGKAFATVDEMAFSRSSLFLKSGKVINCITGELEEGIGFEPILAEYRKMKAEIDLKQIKKFLNNRNSPLHHPKAIFINDQRQLTIDRFSLVLVNSNVLLFRQSSEKYHASETNRDEPLHVSSPFENPNIICYEKEWADGSIAAVDTHGFLHLKSSNDRIPEITIVLTYAKDISAYVSDDSWFGSPYFTDTMRAAESLPPAYFYKTYIHRFISHILQASGLPF